MRHSSPDHENPFPDGPIPPSTAGHCEQDEARLFEYLDGALTAPQSESVEAHLSVCPACRELSEQWLELDFQLATGLKRPSLPAVFKQRVWQGIEKDFAPMYERKRAQLRAHWEADWSVHRRRFLRAQVPAALDYLGYAILAALGGYLLFRLGPRWSNVSIAFAKVALPAWIAQLGLVLTAISLLTGFSLAAKKPLRRWLAAL